MTLRIASRTVDISFVIAYILSFSILLPITANGITYQDKGTGKDNYQIVMCKTTGTYDFGEGDIPIGHLITIANDARKAHIEHGDFEHWEIVALPNGKEVCREHTSVSQDYSSPDKLYRKYVDNTLEVRFVFMSDPHFSKDYDDNHRQHWVSWNINATCNWLKQHSANGTVRGCTGIVSGGDMKSIAGSDFYSSINWFRGSYEDGRSSQDYNVEYPVYIGIGNHDDYSEWGIQDDEDGPEIPYTYVRDRMEYSPALFIGKDASGNTISNYYEDDTGYSDLYAWEWGNFHFIHLGLWAFYAGYSDYNAEGGQGLRNTINWDKITWLQNHLEKIGKEKPIVLFQHFGWDGESLGEVYGPGAHEGDPKWWDDGNVDLLGDVLCGREVTVGDSGPCDPYNVIGIFSGHLHEAKHFPNVCIRGEYQGSAEADLRKWITCDEHASFDNYVVDDAGNDSDEAGFYHVLLQLDSDGNGKMTVNKIRLTKNGDDYNRIAVEPWEEKEFSSNLFLSFDQGEPDNAGGNEDCAVIKSNGRYNDYICHEPRHVLCRDSSGKWHVSASGDYSWNDGFLHCYHYEQSFTQPTSLEEQAEIIDLLQDNDVAEAWINYTDLLKEGDWQEGQPYLAYFGSGEPNNGEDRFERGWGQNCAAIMRDGTIHDFSCEEALDHFLCYDGSAWSVHTKSPGDWKAGSGVCSSYAGQDPDLNELDVAGLMVEKAKEYFEHNPNLSAIWVPFNDLDKEAAWTSDVPWIAFNKKTGKPGGWQGPQPDGGTSQNCALLISDGWDVGWHDAECEQSSDVWPFACRNYETGDWMITTKESKNWIDGFEYCRTEHADQPYGIRWYFATPIRETDNETLRELLENEGLTRVWLNYTDAPSDSGEDMEGFWRHGYWKKWGTNEPNPTNGEDENCAAIEVSPFVNDSFWFDDVCSLEMQIACRAVDDPYPGFWFPPDVYPVIGSWDQGPDLCPPPHTGFAYPTCPSEFEDMNEALSGGSIRRYWIPFHDTYHEGYFRPR